MASHEKYLKQLTITDEIPGTLLKDFETLLSCIGEQQIAVTEGKKLLPMPHVKKINKLLSQPYETGLKRPMHNAFPNVNALYLLFRASGLALVSKKGAKEIIRIDTEMLAQWQNLNPTEQFFSLLEIWLTRADHDIIGEKNMYHSEFFYNNRSFYSKLSEKPMKIGGDSEKESRIHYVPGLINLSLLELFGMIRINAMPIEIGKKRGIDTIVKTLFGDALWHLLNSYESMFHEIQLFCFTEMDGPNSKEYQEALEEWRSAVKSYFPELKNTFTLPQHSFQKGIHIFKLIFYKGWRRIAIPGTALLDDLAQEILSSIDFDNDHLYQFRYQSRTGLEFEIDHPYLDPGNPTTDETRIGDIPIQEGAEMIFIYDFGDNWEFGLVLEERDPEGVKIDKPTVLEAHGKAPVQYGW